jgi:hypothetical protein
MKITEEQRLALREAAAPLMQWLLENCHPHVSVVLDSHHMELMEGLATAHREEPPTT